MLVLSLFVAACSSTASSTPDISAAPTTATTPKPPPDGQVDSNGQAIPAAPATPDGPVANPVADDVGLIVDSLTTGVPLDAIDRLGESADPRVLWLLADLIPFSGADGQARLVSVFEEVTNTEIGDRGALEVVDRLIAWDTPAPPGYREMKASIYALIEPQWEPFFDDADSDIDWRLVSWGGVFIDDRIDAAAGRPCSRGCIPALDDPEVTDASGGDWYPDERLVFGLVINGEARAYPKNIMEVHEMVNNTLGGRRIGMPYCTLCGSAQAYYTDDVEGFLPVLRTSGMLSRSNKVMYDISTQSVLNTFTGEALSGPLREAGVVLNQATVVTSTWGDWKMAHPNTTIVAEDGGINRAYSLDPLGGRDDDGPIFPVGDVDPRLPVQERVLGVIAPDGSPVAFPVGAAVLALQTGETVELAGVRLELDGSGVRAFLEGSELPAHEAFWFAWSQFEPGTLLWERV